MEPREKLTSLGCTQHNYIGDGVYVGIDDARQIWLITNRSGLWHEIALEPEALAALYRYAQSVMGNQDDRTA